MGEPVPSVRFNTADEAVAGQFESWRRGVVGFTVDRLGEAADAPFSARVHAAQIGPLALVASDLGSALRFRGDAQPGQPRNVSIVLLREGYAQGETDGGALEAGAGQVVMFDWRRAVSLDLWPGRTVVLIMPQSLLEADLGELPDLHGVTIGGTAGRIYTNAVLPLAEELDRLTVDDVDLLVRTLVPLVAACVATLPAAGERGDPVEGSAVRRRVARHVAERLAVVDLSPATIVSDLRISRSTLYRAYEGAEGVAAYIRTRRLEAAHAALCDARDHRSVKEIAIAHGFASPPQFNTAFRRRFGYTPLAVRLGRLAWPGADLADTDAAPSARLFAVVAQLPSVSPVSPPRKLVPQRTR